MEEEKEEKKGGWADFESRKRGPGGGEATFYSFEA